MGEVGELETPAFFPEPQSLDAESANFSQSSSVTLWNGSVEVVEVSTSSSAFDPCVDTISDYVCINYPQLIIICFACFTVLLMIFARVLFCLCRRRRRQKRVPDILALEGDIIRTRLNSISVVAAGNPPPRYSKIFDQDGISVFEEAPPDYETTQPDLLKSLPQNLSRTSSLAGKGQPTEQTGPTIVIITEDTEPPPVIITEDTEPPPENEKTSGQQKLPKCPPRTKCDPVVLSIDQLLRDSNQEVTC